MVNLLRREELVLDVIVPVCVFHVVQVCFDLSCFRVGSLAISKRKILTSLIPHAIMCCSLVMKTLSIKEHAALLRELTPLDRVYVRIRA